MKQWYIFLVLLCFCFPYRLFAQGFTEVFPGSIKGISYGSTAWGDYDSDGLLDILVTGPDSNNAPILKLYKNTGNGFSEVYPGSLTGVNNSSVAWGDYDNDGDLDILLTGSSVGNNFISKIYKNTGTAFTEVFTGSLQGVCNSSVAWGDYDNDGDLDILLTGFTGSTYISKIYQNTGTGFTEVYAGSLFGVYLSSVAWGDYDNDGKLDILLTGYNGGAIAKIYRNTGTGFVEVFSTSLSGVFRGAAKWGDYDNDGKLDILLTGFDNNFSLFTKIYRNTGNGFTEVYPGSLTGFGWASAAWGDYDNDGDLDIVICGVITGSIQVSKIYQNTGNGFTEVFPGSLTPIVGSSVAWGDFDNDGDLDILLSGVGSNDIPITKIYKNTGTVFNTAPQAPSGLNASVSGSSVNFRWLKTTDGQTAQNGLSYNLRVGTSTNAVNIESPMANVGNGFRRLAQFGNTGGDTAWTIKNLVPGKYYWSVQAVDNGFAGSQFAPVESVTVARYAITATAGGNGQILPSGVISVDSGASKRFVFSPNANYFVDSVFVDGVYVDSTTGYTFTNVIVNHSISVTFTSSSIFKEVFHGDVTGVRNSSAAWGDYDNDGDLDFVVTGYNISSVPISKIYQNTGSGFTEIYSGSLTGVVYGSVAWGDYDNDGDLDILLTGYFSGGLPISEIYQNTGNGFTEVFAGSLTGVDRSAAAWGDYNNDGRLDIVITGLDKDGLAVSKLYKNTGNGFSEEFAGSLVGVCNGSIAWGDYDNDGDLDILLTGITGSTSGLITSRIYKNTGNDFIYDVASSLNIPGVYNSSVAWGDYDNDGDLDILVTGYSTSIISKIFQNTGSGFTEMFAGNLAGTRFGSVAWGDYDNDGDLDILLTGTTNSGGSISKIYQNTGGGFTEVFAGSLLIVTQGSVAWGDYNNDGRLDILLTGNDGETKIYKNNNTVFNTVPNAPSGLTASRSGSDVTFHWRKPTDGQTPKNGLTYNLRLGTSLNDINIQSPMANAGTGYRRVVQFGNTGHDTLWTVKNLANGTYFWSVQSLDNTFAGSSFTPTLSYQVINSGFTITSTTGVNGSISPSGVTLVDSGSSERFIFLSDAHYVVNTVLIDNQFAYNDSVTGYTFKNINANHTIAVTFRFHAYTISASAGTHGNISPFGAVNVDSNSNQRFILLPDTLYHVSKVLIDNQFSYYDSLDGYTFTNVKANHTISVTFRKYPSYTITATSGVNGSISPSGATAVDSGSNPRFKFLPALNYGVDTLLVDGVFVDSSQGYTFSKVKQNHILSATFKLVRFSITTTAGAHGSVLPAGVTTVPLGANQRFTFVPSSHYRIDTVLVDGVSNIDSTYSYTFYNVRANHTISVTFRYYQYTITATAGSHGSILPSGVVPADSAGSKRFTFSHSTGYHVKTLIVDGVTVDSLNGYTFFNIQANHLISVTFALNRYTVTVSAGLHGTIVPSGVLQADYASSLSFMITPEAGYIVDSILVNGVYAGTFTNYTLSFITIDYTVTVRFATFKFIITATAGANGAISPSGITRGDSGFTQRYTFLSNAGYHLDSVIVDGFVVDSTEGYSFVNVRSNHTIRVTFKVNAYIITVSAGEHGSIFPSGIVPVDSGVTKRFRIVGNTGYQVDSVFADGIRVDSLANYTFSHVQGNHTLRATFKIRTYTIVTSMGLHGVIAPPGNVTVTYGSDKQFTFIPNPNFRSDTVLVDGVVVDSTASYTFINIITNHTIRVVFVSADTTRYTTFTQTQFHEAGVKIKLKGTKPVLPTYGNIRDTVFERGYPKGTIMLLGFQRKDSARSYGWVTYKGGKGGGRVFAKMLPMTSPAQYFIHKGEYRNPLPKKINYNSLAGELITLRLNMLASDYGITTPDTLDQKFGDLYYEDENDDGSVYYGRTIRELARLSDSVLTFAWRVADVSPVILGGVLARINGSFASPVSFSIKDTVSFMKGGLKIKGYKMIREVPYLRRDAGFIPRGKEPFILDGIADKFALEQNYPNPFNPVTVIGFQIPDYGLVSLKVYDVLGREVATLINNETMEEGTHELSFDASRLSSGVYFYRLTVTSLDGKAFSQVRKLVLMK